MAQRSKELYLVYIKTVIGECNLDIYDGCIKSSFSDIETLRSIPLDCYHSLHFDFSDK